MVGNPQILKIKLKKKNKQTNKQTNQNLIYASADSSIKAKTGIRNRET